MGDVETGVSAAQDSDVLRFTAVSGDAAYSRAFVTALAEAYVEYRRQLETQAVEAARAKLEAKTEDLRKRGLGSTDVYLELEGKIEALDTAATLGSNRATLVEGGDRAEKVAPKPLKTGIIGFVLGVLLGVGAAALVDRLDRRVREESELEEIVGAPVIGWLPNPRSGPGLGRLRVSVDPRGGGAEAFRLLRANFDLLRDKRRAVVLVTSALPAEGKTSTTANLGYLLAAAGRKVVIIDCDLRRPSIHQHFAISRVPGLVDVAAGDASLRDSLMDIEVAQDGGGARAHAGWLRCIAAGSPVPNPGEFLTLDWVPEIVEECSRDADVVLLDTPPVLAAGDAVALASAANGFLVVADGTRADRRALGVLSVALRRTGVRVLGIGLTNPLAGGAWKALEYYDQYDATVAGPDRRRDPSKRRPSMATMAEPQGLSE